MKKIKCLLVLILAFSPMAEIAAGEVIPFDLDSGRPMVALKVNGKGPFTFVFDTGSPGMLVMKSLVDELGLEIVGEVELQSPVKGKPVSADVVKVASISLAGIETGNLEAPILNLPEVGLGMGVIGPALFKDHGPITMDFKNNTITIGDEPPSEITTWIPFGDSAPLMDIPIRIGEHEIMGHIDTGNIGVLALPMRYAKEIPLLGPIRTVGHARTLDAEFEIRSAPIDAVATIGNATIHLHELLFEEILVANFGTAGCRGLTLYIDWEKNQFGLTGRSEIELKRVVQKSPPGKERFGLMAIPQPDGTINVAGTEPNSAAEKIGLLPGDRILAVNGTSTKSLKGEEMRNLITQPNLELKVERNGQTVMLKKEE